MSGHTPGPWRVLPEEVDRGYIRIRGTRFGGRYKVANALTVTYAGVHEREAEETRANARLIAAAPELLEALQEMVEYYGTYSAKVEALYKARAAIVKATGGQP